jgi:prophage maintenance system killer protein
MQYLTVHDIVWINSTVTGAVNPYDYVTLECAMAGQYLYGNSENAPEQAAGMLDRLLKKRPFGAGNRRTGLIALLTFLNSNGFAVTLPDAGLAAAILAADRPGSDTVAIVCSLNAPAAEPLPESLTLRKLITHECNFHAEALKLLADGD